MCGKIAEKQAVYQPVTLIATEVLVFLFSGLHITR
jgi:hypothetical protein